MSASVVSIAYVNEFDAGVHAFTDPLLVARVKTTVDVMKVMLTKSKSSAKAAKTKIDDKPSKTRYEISLTLA